MVEDFFGLNRTRYRLENKPLGKGGEADVYKISGNGNLAAKIYKQQKLTPQLEEKLKIMVKSAPASEEFAWPQDILYTRSGKFAGFTMPCVSYKKNLREIYVTEKRKDKTWKFFVRVASNLSAAVNNVHELGHLIGDLNPENILVNESDGKIAIVDTDSFHIWDKTKNLLYPCLVGKPEFVAPELSGTDFSKIQTGNTYNRFTDFYSLAVLIFCLLINGAHPFSCTVSSERAEGKYQQDQNIKNGVCVYFPETYPGNAEIGIPIYSPGIGWLPDEIQDLFYRAFVTGFKKPQNRPSPEEWHQNLKDLEQNLTRCLKVRQHVYFRGSAYCPWCETANRFKRKTKEIQAQTAKNERTRAAQGHFNPNPIIILNSTDNPYVYWSKFLQKMQPNAPPSRNNSLHSTNTGVQGAQARMLYYSSTHRQTLIKSRVNKPTVSLTTEKQSVTSQPRVNSTAPMMTKTTSHTLPNTLTPPSSSTAQSASTTQKTLTHPSSSTVQSASTTQKTLTHPSSSTTQSASTTQKKPTTQSTLKTTSPPYIPGFSVSQPEKIDASTEEEKRAIEPEESEITHTTVSHPYIPGFSMPQTRDTDTSTETKEATTEQSVTITNESSVKKSVGHGLKQRMKNVSLKTWYVILLCLMLYLIICIGIVVLIR